MGAADGTRGTGTLAAESMQIEREDLRKKNGGSLTAERVLAGWLNQLNLDQNTNFLR